VTWPTPFATIIVAVRYNICSNAQEGFREVSKRAAIAKKGPVRGSRSGRPIMALLDLLGRRWTLRIIWELREGALTSRALRAACDKASPTILQTRLTELRGAGFVELAPGEGYRLTPLGRDLFETFMPLHHFAERWSKRAMD
jgi:DNA-binding HxlR family transcriptional regulator